MSELTNYAYRIMRQRNVQTFDYVEPNASTAEPSNALCFDESSANNLNEFVSLSADEILSWRPSVEPPRWWRPLQRAPSPPRVDQNWTSETFGPSERSPRSTRILSVQLTAQLNSLLEGSTPGSAGLIQTLHTPCQIKRCSRIKPDLSPSLSQKQAKSIPILCTENPKTKQTYETS
ncbi:hypothetical protein RRG08_034539 [Elysia crispata]|uniref:Uncharacterized protein n=1 Tax=Elysia crispata TaxID=231223 RepID=A0AAE1ED80_9GAST|nr:hypothetical protein RRG08_034539 [Elysia crispata]